MNTSSDVRLKESRTEISTTSDSESVTIQISYSTNSTQSSAETLTVSED